MRVNHGTEVWRGETFHDTSVLRLGDDVGVRATVSYPSGALIAEQITANIDKSDGRIAKLLPHAVEVALEDERGEPDGLGTVFFDEHTIFDQGSQKELKVGRLLEVIGLDLGPRRMRATRVMTLR